MSDTRLWGEGVIERYVTLTYGEKGGGYEQEDEVELSEDSEIPPSQLLRKRIDLFDYQEDLANQIVALVCAPHGDKSALLTLPTGGGKTRTALSAVLELFHLGRVKRVLWLAPSRELLDQAFVGLRTVWSKSTQNHDLQVYRCHVLKSFIQSDGCAIYFATIQMLVERAKRPRRLPVFDFIVFDEAHHAQAQGFKSAVSVARSQGSKPIPVLGLSATPGRRDEGETQSLVALFGNCLLTSALLLPNAIDELESRGILARLEFQRIALPVKSLDRARVIESPHQMTKPVRHFETDLIRFKAIVQTVKGLSEERKVLVFAGSIAHANALGAALESLGCQLGIVTSQTPVDQRERILKRFETGQLKVLLNKTILATGYDCPAVNDVVLTTPIGSPILFEQIVGRASRGPKLGGNEVARIWQIDNNLAVHGRPASYHRYSDFDWR